MKETRARGLEAIGILWELPDVVSDVWDHMSREEVDGKILQTCNYCGHTKKTSQLMTSRWGQHLVEGCEQVDDEVSKQVYESRKDSVKAVREAGKRRGFAT